MKEMNESKITPKFCIMRRMVIIITQEDRYGAGLARKMIVLLRLLHVNWYCCIRVKVPPGP